MTGVRIAAMAAAAVLAFAPSADASAAAQLKLSKTTGLKVGQTITVASLTGLAPNLASVAVGQCKPVVAGPADCNLTGSLLGSGDAAGKWKPGEKGSTITLVKSVGGVDCTAKAGACIIGVTSLVNPSNVLAKVSLTFSSAGAGGGATTEPTSSAAPSAGTSDPATGLPETGSPDGIPTFALIASALVLSGLAVMFYLPSRRRRTN